MDIDLCGKSVWILDTHSILYQVFHAIPEMTSPDGQPVNALYGFARDLIGLLEHHRPDYLMCAFDLPQPTFRHQQYDQYKANRSAMPDDLQPQIPRAHELLDALAIPGLQAAGFEADDILATVAARTTGAGGNCVLVTSDKDSRQLLGNNVKIWLIRKSKFYTPEDLKEDWGIRPDQVVDFQALVGDSSDNVPGVPKVGPKTAATLLEQFGSLDALLENTEQIKAKGTRTNVENNIDLAKLSQTLVRLDQNVPVTIPWEEAKTGNYNLSTLYRLCRTWGFQSIIKAIQSSSHIISMAKPLSETDENDTENSLLDLSNTTSSSGLPGLSGSSELPGLSGLPGLSELSSAVSTDSTEDKTDTHAETDGYTETETSADTLLGTEIAAAISAQLTAGNLSGPENPTQQSLNNKESLINTEEQLERLAEQISASKFISLMAFGDAPFYSDEPARQQVISGLAISIDPRHGQYIPLTEPFLGSLLAESEAVLDRTTVLDVLKPHLENPQTLKIGHDLKRTRNLLMAQGVELAGPTFDTMIADSLIAPGEASHDLDSIVNRTLNMSLIDLTESVSVKRDKRKVYLSADELPLNLMTVYGGQCARYTLALYPFQLAELEKFHQLKLAWEQEFPLERVLAKMEFTGVRVDLEQLGEMSLRLGTRIDELKDDIFTQAGEQFNLDSPKQLQTILFDKLSLPRQKKTTTGSSTDAEVLETLAVFHPIAKQILEYRLLTKLQGTYIEALPELIWPETGRIHASFNQAVTATGRLSSTHPNLQNIPIRSAEGKQIRKAFIPGNPDWLLIDADYSQIELRVLAHVCEDPALRQAFIDDRDIHAQVAAQIFNVPLDEVTSEQRSNAKAVNFGIIYGQSSFGLARQLGIPKADAARFIDSYFAEFPTIQTFLSKTLAQCHTNQYVETLFGRRRYLSGVRSSHTGQLNTAERMAINTVIQGTAADIIKMAMIEVDRKISRELSQTRLLLQIHDELVLEAPPEEVDAAKSILVDTMQNVFPMSVPLKVEAGVGHNWADAK